MSTLKTKLFDYLTVFIAVYCLAFVGALFSLNIDTPWRHFSDQSQSFLKGKLDVTPLSFDMHDYTIVDGKYYWPQGPFPSVILMPFQLIFGPSFTEGLMQAVLAITLILLVYSLLVVKHIESQSAILLICAFLVASPVVGIIIDPKSWFYAQVVALVLLMALVLELETKRRWWLMGILEACLLATRPTAALIGLALFAIIFLQKITLNKKIIDLTLFLIPVILSILLLMWFNYARFGDPFDNGYLTNDVGGFIGPLRDIGLFSPYHIPTNFYFYFLESVQPVQKGIHLIPPYIKYDYWGLSFFIVAPFFLYSLKSLRHPSLYIKMLWLTVFVTLLIELSYYAPGWYQFGPRYTADFLPILFLLTLYGLNTHKLNLTQKTIICLSALFNLYLLFSPLIFKSPT